MGSLRTGSSCGFIQGGPSIFPTLCIQQKEEGTGSNQNQSAAWILNFKF